MNYIFSDTNESTFERIPDPSPRCLIRLKTFDREWVVLEVRRVEHTDGHKHFFRIEARSLWKEYGAYLSPAMEKFQTLQNAVQATVDTEANVVRFGPVGHIIMAVKGAGLGSYLMSQVIAWLREHHPGCKVLRGSLSPVDARDAENRARRNRFYEKHGFDLVFTDAERTEGYFSKPRAADLMVTPSKIEEFDIDALVPTYCDARLKLADQSRANKSQTEVIRALYNHLDRRFRAIMVLAGMIGLMVAFPQVPTSLHNILAQFFSR